MADSKTVSNHELSVGSAEESMTGLILTLVLLTLEADRVTIWGMCTTLPLEMNINSARTYLSWTAEIYTSETLNKLA